MRIPTSTAVLAMVAATCTVTTIGAVACARPRGLAADLVITRANIWTGNPLQPEARALAIVADRIVEVGAVEDIERWRGTNTTVIDARGQRVMPGFNDAHVHFVDGGRQLDNVNLQDAATPAEFARRIAERAKAKPGEWILGGAWDERGWAPASLPTRQLIDDATNGTPVFVVRHDGHMGLANSAALGRAGVTEQTPDPPGGEIVRDASGFPTGVLKGAAMQQVNRAIPKTTPEQRLRIVKRALEHAASFGVTSVQDMSASYDDLSVYADLAGRGELTARIYAAPAESGWYDQAKLGLHRAFGSPWLRLGAVNGDADAVGARGGLSEETQDVSALRTRLLAADYARLQLCIDADRDAGVAPILGLLTDIVRTNGERDRRLRIEHAQHIAERDVDRLAALKVLASVQPYQASDDREPVETAPLRTLRDQGIRLALGSDWPLAPLNPMLTLYAASVRGTVDGRVPDQGQPEQTIPIRDGAIAYTSAAAFAEFQDVEKGTIARGKLADVIILSDDIFSIPPDRIKDVRVLTTVAGGKIVHQRNP